VHVIRQRDVDGVDIAVREQCVVASVGALDPVRARVLARARLVATRNRNDVDAL
jgi:hypothetical protein